MLILVFTLVLLVMLDPFMFAQEVSDLLIWKNKAARRSGRTGALRLLQPNLNLSAKLRSLEGADGQERSAPGAHLRKSFAWKRSLGGPPEASPIPPPPPPPESFQKLAEGFQKLPEALTHPKTLCF